MRRNETEKRCQERADTEQKMLWERDLAGQSIGTYRNLFFLNHSHYPLGNFRPGTTCTSGDLALMKTFWSHASPDISRSWFQRWKRFESLCQLRQHLTCAHFKVSEALCRFLVSSSRWSRGRTWQCAWKRHLFLKMLEESPRESSQHLIPTKGWNSIFCYQVCSVCAASSLKSRPFLKQLTRRNTCEFIHPYWFLFLLCVFE